MCDPGCTHWRIVIGAWETWTVAAADGVGCARVRWEINFLLTFETAPFFCVYPAHIVPKFRQRQMSWIFVGSVSLCRAVHCVRILVSGMKYTVECAQCWYEIAYSKCLMSIMGYLSCYFGADALMDAYWIRNVQFNPINTVISFYFV